MGSKSIDLEQIFNLPLCFLAREEQQCYYSHFTLLLLLLLLFLNEWIHLQHLSVVQ